MDSMYGKSMSPRKVMAGGMTSGNFGVRPMPSTGAKGRPEMKMAPGSMMDDANRGIGTPVGGGKNAMPAQSHPSHGPASDMGWMRGGKM